MNDDDYGEELARWAVTCADFYKALRDQGMPEQLASDLTYAWCTPDADPGD